MYFLMGQLGQVIETQCQGVFDLTADGELKMIARLGRRVILSQTQQRVEKDNPT
jgi:hypothetical protein